MRITVAVVAILALVAVSWADNPGIKARITNRGLELFLQSAINSAMKKIKSNPIPLSTDARGVFYSMLPAKFIKPKLVNGTFGSVSLTAVDNTCLQLTMRKAEVNISLRGWIEGYDELGWDDKLLVNNIDLDMDLYIVGKGGRPQVTDSNCAINDLTYTYKPSSRSGSYWAFWHKLYREACKQIGEFIGGTLNGEIRNATSPAEIVKKKNKDQIKVMTFFKDYVGKYLKPGGTVKQTPIKMELMHKFAKTSYGKDYVDVYLTGDVYWNGTTTVKQFTPAAFPAYLPVDKMLYFWLSEAVFNNRFAVAHNLTIFKKRTLHMLVKTAAAPTVTFHTLGVLFKVACNVTMKLSDSGQPINKFFSMELDINAKFEVVKKQLTTKVTHTASKFKNIKGFETFQKAVEHIAIEFVTEKLPFKLPLPIYVYLLNGVVTPTEGFIMIEADAEIRM